MWPLLESLENSGFSIWVREANTVWAYTTVLVVHTFGLAFLVGLSSGIAMRILGFAPDLPLASMGKLFPLIRTGFWVALASGVVLWAIDARAFLEKPGFYIKLLSIVIAAVNLRWLEVNVVGAPAGPVSTKGKIVAAALLTAWAVAVTAGRLTAYDNFIQVESAIAVLILTVVLLAARHIGARLLGRNEPARQPRVITTK